MRGLKGSFEKTVINIKKLIEYGFDVHITTVVDSKFAGEIIKTVTFLNTLGVKNVAFLGLIPIDSGENNIFQNDCQRKLTDQINEASAGGNNLSVGQRQRIAIARAFLKNSPIILMDEPSSALDIISERKINQALEELIKNRVVIMVSHRKESFDKFDYVMNL